MNNFYIDSLGCALRNLDSVKVENFFIANGWKPTSDFLEADIVIYVSCGVVKSNEKTSFEFVNKALESRKKTILLGCVSVQSPSTMEEYNSFENLIVLPTHDLYKIDLYFPDFKIKFRDIENPHYIKDRHTLGSVYHKAYLMTFSELLKSFSMSLDFLKFFSDIAPYIRKRKQVPIVVISKGCNQNCSYCTIKNAVGKLESNPLKDIISEVKQLIESGHSVIALDADDTGGYGKDIGINFSILLDELYKINGANKVRLMIDEFNPIWLIKYYDAIEKHVYNGFIYRMLIPIQSGSPRVLRSMNRFNDIDKIIESINNLKSVNRKFTCCTHILADYVTETEDDFDLSLNAIEKLKIDRVLFMFYHLNDTKNSFKEIKQVKIDKIHQVMSKLSSTYDIHI